MVEATRSLLPQRSAVIAVLAKQAAIRAVKRQLQAQGREVWDIHADMAAELALASSGMTTPFPCAIFLAYNTRLGP